MSKTKKKTQNNSEQPKHAKKSGVNDNTKKENTKKENTKKENTKKENTKKDNTKKDNTKKDNTKKDNTKKENGKKDHMKKDNLKRDNIKKDNMKKDNNKKESKRSQKKKSGVCLVIGKSMLVIVIGLSAFGMLYFMNDNVREIVDPYIEKARTVSDAYIGKAMLSLFQQGDTPDTDTPEEKVKESYPLENDFIDDGEGELQGNLPPPDTKESDSSVEDQLKETKSQKTAEAPKETAEEIQKAEEAKKAEEDRIAAEEAKKVEEARVAAEEAKKAEEARIAAEEARIAAEEAKKVEEARIAAEEAKKAEEARIAAEEAKKAEEARIAAEEAREAEETRLAEEARQAEEAQKAEIARQKEASRREEEARIAAEEEARIADEEARREEEARIAAEEARREEEARIAAEEARREEEARIATEEARREEARIEAEEARQEEEARIAAEEARQEEEARIAAEEARREEEARIAAEEARREEEARIAAEEARIAAEEARREEARIAAEEARREEEARIAAEEARQAEEARRAEEARQEEEAKRAAEEARRISEEARETEELRKAEAEKVAEEARRSAEEAQREAEEADKAEEVRKAAEEARREADEAREAERQKEAKRLKEAEEASEKIEESNNSATSKKKSKKHESYEKSDITNDEDHKIRKELDAADELLEKGYAKESLNAFNKILEKSIKSPRATYGRSGALLKLAELQSSNTLLQQGIQVLEVLLSNPDIPDALLLKSGLILADKQRFRGWTNRALKSLTFLNLRFPNNIDVINDLGTTNLISGRNDDAKKLFKQVLSIDADNGFALAHLGFIIKVSDNNPAKAIPYLKSGIESGDKNAVDARFFFHLGDAYQRVGQSQKAREVYDDGAAKKLFLSRDQRSLYNVDRLTGKPWWLPEELPYQDAIETLQNNWEMIRDEVLEYVGRSGTDFVEEAENLLDKGMWKQMTLYQRGERIKKGCLNVLKTCALLDHLHEATNCKRGQVKFSIMRPGSHVWPHCGPTNCRLRAHLGLVVPEGVKIRVGNKTRYWKEGEFLIFDDSFEHEVWHQGSRNRIVLIVDFWHPELTDYEKATLSPI